MPRKCSVNKDVSPQLPDGGAALSGEKGSSRPTQKPHQPPLSLRGGGNRAAASPSSGALLCRQASCPRAYSQAPPFSSPRERIFFSLSSLHQTV